MKIAELTHSIELSHSDDTGHFLLSLQGSILACNSYGAELFRYDSQKRLVGLHLNNLVPEEFAKNLPEEITKEHLTNGQFLERVNQCADGTLISTLVKTQSIRIEQHELIECFIKLNEAAVEPISEQRYRQTTELLKCEVIRLKSQVSQSKADVLIEPALVDVVNEQQIPLTQNDLRFCSLLLRGLSTKAIAQELNITQASAYKLRKRIRKKFNLSLETNLYNYLVCIINANQ